MATTLVRSLLWYLFYLLAEIRILPFALCQVWLYFSFSCTPKFFESALLDPFWRMICISIATPSCYPNTIHFLEQVPNWALWRDFGEDIVGCYAVW